MPVLQSQNELVPGMNHTCQMFYQMKKGLRRGKAHMAKTSNTAREMWRLLEQEKAHLG
jgi:hypothetical protein